MWHGRCFFCQAIRAVIDRNFITWRATDREIDSSRKEDSEEFIFVRRGPAPE
jgi:hypothetical protein